jgi:hypothetical protein
MRGGSDGGIRASTEAAPAWTRTPIRPRSGRTSDVEVAPVRSATEFTGSPVRSISDRPAPVSNPGSSVNPGFKQLPVPLAG